MTQKDPHVSWTDEQWARVQQVIQQEASRARVAATFLPLVGSLPPGTDFVRKEAVSYAQGQIHIDDKSTVQLATLQVKVPLRGAQVADPDMTSALTLFRRAANVLARLEDAVVFRGIVKKGNRFTIDGDLKPEIWEIRAYEIARGLFDANSPPVHIGANTGEALVTAVSTAIANLEGQGHFGPFAVVLGQDLFLLAQTPAPSLALPQDRIIPFLAGGSLLRSSVLPPKGGVVVALGGAPVELVIAKDVTLDFLQQTEEGDYLFRVLEKLVLRVKEPEAIVRLER